LVALTQPKRQEYPPETVAYSYFPPEADPRQPIPTAVAVTLTDGNSLLATSPRPQRRGLVDIIVGPQRNVD